MSKLPDILGSLNNIFQIGLGAAGAKTLRFNNGFLGDLSWNPTAQRSIELPDATGTLALSEVGTILSHGVNQSIPNNALTALVFTSEEMDNGGYHSNVTNPSRITIPRSGIYLMGGSVAFAAAMMGIRQISIRSGANVYGIETLNNPGGASQTVGSIVAVAPLSAGNYIELLAFQNSGASLDIAVNSLFSPRFWVIKL